MDSISVMLSSYNGEKYIREQLDSILNQKNVDLWLFIRDDGSTDSTKSIITEYCTKYKNITLYEGENIGYVKSFMWLLNNIPKKKEMYFAFADQDDVWDDDKLSAAIDMIKSKGFEYKPCLYYSDLKVVDENLNFIRLANTWEGNFDKYQALMFIAVRGCTMVFNSKFHQILTSCYPNNVAGHDTFVALLAFWTGNVVYDSTPHINYRQTGSNLSITGTSKLDALKKNLRYVKRRINDKSNERELNANVLLDGYSSYISCSKDVEKVACYRKSFKNKIRLLKDKRFFSFHFSINLVNSLLILFGKL